MESKSYKELPKIPQTIFWIEIRGDREEFKSITSELEKTENVHFKGKLAYPPFAMALPPYEVFFSIIAAAGSLATIADILHKYLKKKKNEKEKLIAFKFDGKEMTIKGNYSKNEILTIIQGFSRVAEVEEINEISKERRKELRAELNELKKNLENYRKLVEIGESKTKLSKEWQSTLEHYRARKAEIESRISVIKELL